MRKEKITTELLAHIEAEKSACKESILRNNPGFIELNNEISTELKWKLNRAFAMLQDMDDCLTFVDYYEDLLKDYPGTFEQSFIDAPENRILIKQIQAYYVTIVTFYLRSFTISETDHKPKVTSSKHKAINQLQDKVENFFT